MVCGGLSHDTITNNYHGIQHGADLLLFALLTFVVWHQIVGELFTWNAAKDMKHPATMKPKHGLRVAFLTAFVPGKEPYDVLENALRSMVAADYRTTLGYSTRGTMTRPSSWPKSTA